MNKGTRYHVARAIGIVAIIGIVLWAGLSYVEPWNVSPYLAAVLGILSSIIVGEIIRRRRANHEEEDHE